MFYYYMDPTYILVLIGVVICMAASSKMNRTFQKYSRVRSHNGMTGREAAERILHSQGIYDVRVEHVSGNLTDHYDPRNKVLRLSDATWQSTSVAAIGVAAHECGHALHTACKGICAALYPKYTGTGSKFWKRYCMAIDHSGTDL